LDAGAKGEHEVEFAGLVDGNIAGGGDEAEIEREGGLDAAAGKALMRAPSGVNAAA